MPTTRLWAALACLVALSACSEGRVDPDQVDAVEPPKLGACRVLTPADVAKASNATRIVDCAKPHTAQTYAIGEMPEEFEDADYDDKAVADFALKTCGDAFPKFLGADESLVMRSLLSWAWFRPSEKAWDDGARWYRCDVVGGGDDSQEYVDLPKTAKGLLGGNPADKAKDQWTVCAAGEQVHTAAKVPCTEPHQWRAVTTVKVGLPEDPYPGDRVVEVRSREQCKRSVNAWLNYPVDYDFAYTWFHEAEWTAGNRRSICWARTDK